MKIKSNVLVVAIVVILFGGILITSVLGLWQTESNKQPRKLSQGVFAGMSDPEDIRGSYSFLDIENAFGVDAEIISEAFNIKRDNPEAVKAKDLESIYTGLEDDKEIGTGSIRYFISLYTGLPYAEMEYLPNTAVEVLKKAGKWSDQLEGKTAPFIIDVSNIEIGTVEQGDYEENSQEEYENEEHNEIGVVKGKTTVAEAISWGISKEKVEEILGVNIENENMTIRDICDQNGLKFGEIKISISESL
ncbi:hypothetical protein [Clostridium sp. DL1XJH146]